MSALSRTRIGVIGAGNMGQALIKGLLHAGLPVTRLLVVEQHPETRRSVENRYHVVSVTLEVLAKRCPVIILAVKPQDAKTVLLALRQAVAAKASAKPLLISIAAGLPTRALERVLGQRPVIRVMPNLPATVGCAMSVITPGRWATSRHRAIARAIFASVGDIVELPERLFDVVTAISGSGPAYFFLFFQALRDAGVQGGMPKAVAQQLAVQTALGSVKLVAETSEELDTLIDRVASKRGTTEAALRTFRQRHLTKTIQAGVVAAAKRSKELTALLSQEAGKRE